MLIKNDYLLNKVFAGKKPDDEGIKRTLFYLYRNIGYQETLELPVPVFIGLVKFINDTELKKPDA